MSLITRVIFWVKVLPGCMSRMSWVVQSWVVQHSCSVFSLDFSAGVEQRKLEAKCVCVCSSCVLLAFPCWWGFSTWHGELVTCQDEMVKSPFKDMTFLCAFALPAPCVRLAGVEMLAVSLLAGWGCRSSESNCMKLFWFANVFLWNSFRRQKCKIAELPVPAFSFLIMSQNSRSWFCYSSVLLNFECVFKFVFSCSIKGIFSYWQQWCCVPI